MICSFGRGYPCPCQSCVLPSPFPSLLSLCFPLLSFVFFLPCPFGVLPRPFCPKPLPPPFILINLLEYVCCGHSKFTTCPCHVPRHLPQKSSWTRSTRVTHVTYAFEQSKSTLSPSMLVCFSFPFLSILFHCFPFVLFCLLLLVSIALPSSCMFHSFPSLGFYIPCLLRFASHSQGIPGTQPSHAILRMSLLKPL